MSNFICTPSPQCIILGCGNGMQPHMLPLLRRQVLELLNGYVDSPTILKDINSYIVAPGLGNKTGVLGAIALARQAAAWL